MNNLLKLLNIPILLFLFFSTELLSKNNCNILKKVFYKCARSFSYSECKDITYKNENFDTCFTKKSKKNVKYYDNYNNKNVKKIQNYAKVVSRKYSIDYRMILAIIEIESNYQTNVTSHKNAVGVMQILASTAQELSPQIHITPKKLKNYKLNIDIGVKYFSYLLKKCNRSYKKALSSYNMGNYAFMKQFRKNRRYPPAALRYINKINKVLKKGLI
jgi:soluble lytic murein transglycosylase-like protein